MIVICLLVGSFLLGFISSNFKTTEIPDNLEIMNTKFELTSGILYIECTTNIISDKLSYEMAFKRNDETITMPLTCEEGVFKAEDKYSLTTNYRYTVNLIVSNGKDKILIPIASDFKYRKDMGLTWINKYRK